MLDVGYWMVEKARHCEESDKNMIIAECFATKPACRCSDQRGGRQAICPHMQGHAKITNRLTEDYRLTD